MSLFYRRDHEETRLTNDGQQDALSFVDLLRCFVAPVSFVILLSAFHCVALVLTVLTFGDIGFGVA